MRLMWLWMNKIDVVAYSAFETRNAVDGVDVAEVDDVFVDLQPFSLVVQLIENILIRMRYRVYRLTLVRYYGTCFDLDLRFMASWTTSPLRTRFSSTALTVMLGMMATQILLLFVTIVG